VRNTETAFYFPPAFKTFQTSSLKVSPRLLTLEKALRPRHDVAHSWDAMRTSYMGGGKGFPTMSASSALSGATGNGLGAIRRTSSQGLLPSVLCGIRESRRINLFPPSIT
jgi:hypothetical protein